MNQTGIVRKDINKFKHWMVITLVISIVLTVFFIIFSHPLSFLVERGFSEKNMDVVKNFLALVFERPSFLFNQYAAWARKLSASREFSINHWIPILPLISLPLGLIIGFIICPYRLTSPSALPAAAKEKKLESKKESFDQNGEFIEPYKEYYENGQLKREIFYQNGKAVGSYKEYYPNGQIQKKWEDVYDKGDDKFGPNNGYAREYYETGKLKQEEFYKNGKHVGYFAEYYPNGQIQKEWEDVCDKGDDKFGPNNGFARTYYENGQLKKEAFYKDGQIEGVVKEYCETGELEWETPYKNGKQDGVMKRYTKDGQIEATVVYKDGFRA